MTRPDSKRPQRLKSGCAQLATHPDWTSTSWIRAQWLLVRWSRHAHARAARTILVRNPGDGLCRGLDRQDGDRHGRVLRHWRGHPGPAPARRRPGQQQGVSWVIIARCVTALSPGRGTRPSRLRAEPDKASAGRVFQWWRWALARSWLGWPVPVPDVFSRRQGRKLDAFSQELCCPLPDASSACVDTGQGDVRVRARMLLSRLMRESSPGTARPRSAAAPSAPTQARSLATGRPLAVRRRRSIGSDPPYSRLRRRYRRRQRGLARRGRVCPSTTGSCSAHLEDDAA